MTQAQSPVRWQTSYKKAHFRYHKSQVCEHSDRWRVRERALWLTEAAPPRKKAKQGGSLDVQVLEHKDKETCALPPGLMSPSQVAFPDTADVTTVPAQTSPGSLMSTEYM